MRRSVRLLAKQLAAEEISSCEQRLEVSDRKRKIEQKHRKIVAGEIKTSKQMTVHLLDSNDTDGRVKKLGFRVKAKKENDKKTSKEIDGLKRNGKDARNGIRKSGYAKKAKEEERNKKTRKRNHSKRNDKDARNGIRKSGYAKKAKEEERNKKTRKQNYSKRNDKDARNGIKCKKFIGAHFSIAGGLHNAAIYGRQLNADAFGLFLRNQRQWNCKPLENEAAKTFQQVCCELNFTPWQILPHGSYLMNFASPNPETLQKSRDALIEELQRCEKLGLMLYNFHPGSTCGQLSREEGIKLIAESINIAHRATNHVITVIENMSGQKNVIGSAFKDLSEIIEGVLDKSRVGVCLDTCHAFAAGYDLASKSGFQKMTDEFERVIGFRYLRAVHINDSKGELGCHLDRHENIGKGKIGVKGFKRIMQDDRFNGIPMILETPSRFDMSYQDEIKLLRSFFK